MNAKPKKIGQKNDQGPKFVGGAGTKKGAGEGYKQYCKKRLSRGQSGDGPTDVHEGGETLFLGI